MAWRDNPAVVALGPRLAAGIATDCRVPPSSSSPQKLGQAGYQFWELLREGPAFAPGIVAVAPNERPQPDRDAGHGEIGGRALNWAL